MAVTTMLRMYALLGRRDRESLVISQLYAADPPQGSQVYQINSSVPAQSQSLMVIEKSKPLETFPSLVTFALVLNRLRGRG